MLRKGWTVGDAQEKGWSVITGPAKGWSVTQRLERRTILTEGWSVGTATPAMLPLHGRKENSLPHSLMTFTARGSGLLPRPPLPQRENVRFSNMRTQKLRFAVPKTLEDEQTAVLTIVY